MKQSGLGIASLVLGIIGLCLSCVIIGIIPCAIGLILAIVGLMQKDRGHGTAIAGLVCSVIGIGIFLFVIFALGASDNISNETSNISTVVESSDIEHEEGNFFDETDNGEYEPKEREFIQDPFELSAGVYVVGEDIEEGKYDIIALEGGANVFIYSSYDDFDKGGFPKSDYILGTGKIAEGFEFMYSEKVSNIRLKNGEVLEIYSGLVVEMVEKK